MNQLDLPKISVWTACWSSDKALCNRLIQVLVHCQSVLRAKEYILLSSINVPVPPGIKIYRILPLRSMGQWSLFVNYTAPKYIKGEYSMSVHEDGFPIRPDLWDDQFLAYDYIGAPWPNGTVGNGGFNIESQKLLHAKLRLPMTRAAGIPSDNWICETNRKWLERIGIRFAPTELALKFSTEQLGNDKPSFGFHGRGPCKHKYDEGWKLIENPAPVVIPPPPPPPPIPENDNGLIKPEVEVPVPFRAKSESVIPITQRLKTVVVYVYPNIGLKYYDYAQRFIRSYQEFPAICPHDLAVVVNDDKQRNSTKEVFKNLPVTHFLFHDNSGYDLGAFQKAAREIPCDLMVFFGASTFFTREGWLLRMLEAHNKHGLALYGAMGNRGNKHYKVWPHIRTTAFWCHPFLMNAYPKRIAKKEERFPFEHGPDSLTAWVIKKGLKAWVVTWKAEYEWENWDDDPEGFQRGHQRNLLALDHITEPPYWTPKEP